MKKVLGLWAPTGDIRGVPVQGSLPDPEQRGPVRLTHERAAAHKTVDAPNHVRKNVSQGGRLKEYQQNPEVPTICRI